MSSDIDQDDTIREATVAEEEAGRNSTMKSKSLVQKSESVMKSDSVAPTPKSMMREPSKR